MTQELFLTPDELQFLTGYTWKADQRRELASQGIKFLVNRLGQPIVMRDALAEHMGCTNRQVVTPDLEALEALDNGTKA